MTSQRKPRRNASINVIETVIRKKKKKRNCHRAWITLSLPLCLFPCVYASQGQRSLMGCRLWGRRVGHDWCDLAAAACIHTLFLLINTSLLHYFPPPCGNPCLQSWQARVPPPAMVPGGLVLQCFPCPCPTLTSGQEPCFKPTQAKATGDQ